MKEDLLFLGDQSELEDEILQHLDRVGVDETPSTVAVKSLADKMFATEVGRGEPSAAGGPVYNEQPTSGHAAVADVTGSIGETQDMFFSKIRAAGAAMAAVLPEELDALYDGCGRHELPLWEEQLSRLYHIMVDGIADTDGGDIGMDRFARPGMGALASSRGADGSPGGMTEGGDRPTTTRNRPIAFEEFFELCTTLLKDAGVGEPLDERFAKETYSVLINFYRADISMQEFALQLRMFHLRPAADVLMPPVDVFTVVYGQSEVENYGEGRGRGGC